MIIPICVSTLFGIACVMTPYLKPSDTHSLNLYRFPLGIGAYIIAFLLLRMIVRQYHEVPYPVKCKMHDGKLFGISFLCVLVTGLFWLLIYYPGLGMTDTINVIGTGMRFAPQHPWFYCLLVDLITRTVLMFGGDYETVLLTESLLQIIIAAGVCGHCITWLKNKGLGIVPLACILGIYSLDPMLNMYQICLFKDVLYAYLIMEWVMILYDLYETKGHQLGEHKTIIKMVFLIILSLLRNNGVYVTSCILLSVLLMYHKYAKRILILFIALLLTIGGSVLFERTNNITHLFKETAGIPLQQIAAVITASDKGIVTDDQREFINEIIPTDFIKEHYNPYTADPLKWGGAPLNNSFLNSHKKEFLKTWFAMLAPNLKIYVKAYLQATYGFWATEPDHISRYSTVYVESKKEWFEENDIDIQNILPSKVERVLKKLTYDPTGDALGEGQLFWLMLLLLLVFISLFDRLFLIVGIPPLAGWLTIMVSTPVAHQWRYVLYIALCLPIYAGLLLTPHKSTEQNSVTD